MNPKLDAFLRSMPGAVHDYKPEWAWDRYMVGGRMFAAVCSPDARHGTVYGGKTLLTLKCDPLESEALRARYACVMPGFYMDKRCYISIDLNAAFDETLLFSLCERAYQLVLAKLTRAQRALVTPPAE